MEFNSKTLRGQVIELVLDNVLKENLFTYGDLVQERIVEALEETVGFPFEVTQVKNIDDYFYGDVQYNNENGEEAVIRWTVSSLPVKFEEVK